MAWKPSLLRRKLRNNSRKQVACVIFQGIQVSLVISSDSSADFCPFVIVWHLFESERPIWCWSSSQITGIWSLRGVSKENFLVNWGKWRVYLVQQNNFPVIFLRIDTLDEVMPRCTLMIHDDFLWFSHVQILVHCEICLWVPHHILIFIFGTTLATVIPKLYKLIKTSNISHSVVEHDLFVWTMVFLLIF